MFDNEMRDSSEFRTLSGGRKKFLYSGPNSKTQQEEDQWSFAPKLNGNAGSSNTPRGGLPINLDDVWSIRNVGLKSGNQSVRSEPTTFHQNSMGKTTNTTFYSRHGGLRGPQQAGQQNGSANPTSSGTNWSSSGHAFSQSSRLNQPPVFQKPSEMNRQRHKNPSPFTKDINDF